MYSASTAYVTKDSYFEEFGIDLEIELKDGYTDNPSKKCELFIKQVKTWLYKYMLRRYDTTQWETDWDDDVFTEALLWQIKHVIDFGDDGNIDPTAFSILREHGMANRSHL